MSFENIKQLTKGTAQITIKGNTEEVRLLKVHEREFYDSLVNEGFGTVQANLGHGTESKANMNIKKVNEAQKRAEHYLIRQSFITPEGKEITESDIDELYDLYDPLVSELKRVNGIIDASNEELAETLSRNAESKIKK